jgi:hypothetical protein
MKLDFSRTGWLGVVNLSLGGPYAAPETPDLISANIIFDRLLLDIAAPLNPDSLHYQITINDDEYTISPTAYSPQFQFTAFVEQSGSVGNCYRSEWPEIRLTTGIVHIIR